MDGQALPADHPDKLCRTSTTQAQCSNGPLGGRRLLGPGNGGLSLFVWPDVASVKPPGPRPAAQSGYAPGQTEGSAKLSVLSLKKAPEQ